MPNLTVRPAPRAGSAGAVGSDVRWSMVLSGPVADAGELGVDAATVLDFAVAARRAEWEAGRARLRLAARWCALHPATEDTGAASWGDAGLPGLYESEELLGGEGTPAVAAFTPEPLAAALGVSTHAAISLLADALDLVHRLPGLWGCVHELEVAPWLARRVAELTRRLNIEAVGWVDRELSARIRSGRAHGTRTLDWLVAQALATHQPELVREREEAAKDSWDVTLSRGLTAADAAPEWAATSELHARGDTVDLTAFYDLVSAEAARLGRLGDTDPLGARKAKALGVIAGTQPTLDCDAPEAPDPPAQETPVAPRGAGARTVLYLHLSLAELVAGAAAGARYGSVERLGPVTVERIREWAGRTQLTVRPVLDLDRLDAVDVHDPPEWMREQVVLRDGHCVFPQCGRDARACDLDHIEPYVEPGHGGPPGQTSPVNLAPLCRRHHRAKTARAWHYRREPDGSYIWTDRAHGRRYRVVPRGGGTRPLGP